MAAGGLTMSGFGDVFITVFADASHCPRTLATGVGFWMKYTNKQGKVQTLTDSNSYRDVKYPHLAELLGLEFALENVAEHVDCAQKTLVLQCDNRWALSNIKLPSEMAQNLKGYKAKWVKGHQGNKNARSYVNEVCDKLAGQAMRRVRDEIDSGD